MTDNEISEEGRKARFAQWEQLGVEAVKQDLATGGFRFVGGPPQVRELAREWVRIKEAGEQAKHQNIQEDAFALLKAIERATRGSAVPVILEELPDLQMTADEARAAFHYLKGKGWIKANFAPFYAAIISAAGHDAIKEAESAPEHRAAAVTPVAEGKSSELLTLKPGIWGISIDLKEAARQLRKRLKKKS
jgi:hypothetical protein